MKTRIFVAVLLLFISTPIIQATTNGYLSFEYFADLKNPDGKSNSFQNAQVGILFSGALSLSIDYAAELRYQEGKVHADMAWVRFFSSDKFRFKLGLYLVPFGRYNGSSRPHETLLVRPPLNIESAYPSRWRDIGAVIEGRIGGLAYSVYSGNGLSEAEALNEGQQFFDNNTNKSIGGRIGWFLSQGFEVAYSLYRGKMDESNSRTTLLQSVDVSWNTEGFQLLSEYTRGEAENGEGFDAGRIDGYFIQASVVLQKILPVVCYQKVRYTDPFRGAGFLSPDIQGQGIDRDRIRWAFGIVYQPSMSILLKIEYDLERDRLADIRTSAIFVQAALSF